MNKVFNIACPFCPLRGAPRVVFTESSLRAGVDRFSGT